MQRHLNPQTMSAMAGGLLLFLAILYAILSNPLPVPIGRMTFKGDPLVMIEASVPDIADFAHFNINPENPFVPYNVRLVERELHKLRNAGTRPLPPPNNGNKSNGQVIVKTIKKPVLVLPKLTPAGASAPRVIGMIGSEKQSVLMVRDADSLVATPVPIGGSFNGWTLISIESGNQAVWEDVSGTRHTFPIGEAHFGDPQTLVGDGDNDKDKDKGNTADKKTKTGTDTADKTRKPAPTVDKSKPAPPVKGIRTGEMPKDSPYRRSREKQPVVPPSPDKM
jgi:hypothetical protein